MKAIGLAAWEGAFHPSIPGGRREERTGWRQGEHPVETVSIGEGMSHGTDLRAI